MDSVRHGEDPCADQPDNRPAIETVVRTEKRTRRSVPAPSTAVATHARRRAAMARRSARSRSCSSTKRTRRRAETMMSSAGRRIGPFCNSSTATHFAECGTELAGRHGRRRVLASRSAPLPGRALHHQGVAARVRWRGWRVLKRLSRFTTLGALRGTSSAMDERDEAARVYGDARRFDCGRVTARRGRPRGLSSAGRSGSG